MKSMMNQIAGHTICAFGFAVAWPIQGIMKRFPEEIMAKIEASCAGIKIERRPLNYEVLNNHHG